MRNNDNRLIEHVRLFNLHARLRVWRIAKAWFVNSGAFDCHKAEVEADVDITKAAAICAATDQGHL
jgi:hypothetical protein